MSAQVIFLPPHYITREEEIRRMEVAWWVESARRGMMNRIINYPDYWKVIEKERFHQELRSYMKLVPTPACEAVESVQ